MSVRVETGGRLHFGFCNLSLAHDRLYGSLGVALDQPRTIVEVLPADDVACDHPRARQHAERACELLDVPGARVTVHETLPVHVGLGSGTQLALAVLTAVARIYDREPTVRERAPDLGRGGRSGVGVATFEAGGFVLDAGHPTERFTTERPPRGEWTVPAVTARHTVPDHWRFVLVFPAAPPGNAGAEEDESMRASVEAASPDIADRIAGEVTRRVLPSLTEGDANAFGAAVAEIGRLNGAWYADEQGGVYRPPVGSIVDTLGDHHVVSGAGQSSWGPTVYGVTDERRADAAREAGRAALDATGVEGDVRVVAPRNVGARSEESK